MLALRVESWIWYAIALFVTICRFISRTLHFGSVKKWDVDDWLMVLAVCTYSTLLVSMNIVADVQTNLFEPGFDLSTLTPVDVKKRVYGSKMVLVVEQMQCVLIWTLKATLIIMYYRLTEKLKKSVAVMYLAVYVGVGLIVMEVLYLGFWCRPFNNYWAVPSPNVQCTTAMNHLITNAVLNISSDLVMFGIGLNLFARCHLPWKRKIILLCIFGLGIFVIISAGLNKYYSFTQPFGALWTFWYIRECSTAMIVANLPFTWTLLRRVFKLNAFDHVSNNSIPLHHSSCSARVRLSRHTHQNLPSNGNSETDQVGINRNSYAPSIEAQSWYVHGQYERDARSSSMISPAPLEPKRSMDSLEKAILPKPQAPTPEQLTPNLSQHHGLALGACVARFDSPIRSYDDTDTNLKNEEGGEEPPARASAAPPASQAIVRGRRTSPDDRGTLKARNSDTRTIW